MVLLGDGMLVVSSQREFARQLISILSPVVSGTHSIADSGALARRLTARTRYDAVLITGRLPDETHLSLAAGLAANGVERVIVIVDRAYLADAHELLDGTGVMILSKPITKEALRQAVKLVIKMGSGDAGIFEKAKLMLMQQKNWTEPQAHRYIQKMSMEKRLPRDVMAQYVIKALERERNGKK